MIMETVYFTIGIIILLIGMALGIYIGLQSEKEIDNNIKEK